MRQEDSGRSGEDEVRGQPGIAKALGNISGFGLQSILSLLLRPLLFGLYFISGFVSRRANLWVFGCWDGVRFSDNAGVLFRHVSGESERDVDAVWISRSSEVVREIRGMGLEAHHRWSIRGMAACLRAGVYAYSNQPKDINYWLSRGAAQVYLGHGSGIKRAGRSIEQPDHRLYQLHHGTFWQRAFWSVLLPWQRVVPDYALATSEYASLENQKNQGLPPEHMAVTGYPRADILFGEPPLKELDSELAQWLAEMKLQEKTILVHTPTFRDHGHGPFPAIWKDFESSLQRLNAVLLIHAHFVQARQQQQFQFESSDSIRRMDPELDLMALFPEVDILISDFSSVIYDWLLTGKPVVFFVPDQEDFVENCRGLNYPYDEVTPGPKPRTLEELGSTIERIQQGLPVEGHDNYERVAEKFHRYRSGGASARASRLIYEKFVAV